MAEDDRDETREREREREREVEAELERVDEEMDEHELSQSDAEGLEGDERRTRKKGAVQMVATWTWVAAAVATTSTEPGGCPYDFCERLLQYLSFVVLTDRFRVASSLTASDRRERAGRGPTQRGGPRAFGRAFAE
jgi:hypothetical protein